MKGGMKYERVGSVGYWNKKNEMLVDVMIEANMPIKFMNNGCLIM